MDPTVVFNLGVAMREFWEAAEKQFGPGVNVYARQDSLELATAGVESDVHVEVLRINLVTGEQTVLIPPPEANMVALSMPEELQGSLKIGINR